MTLNARRLRCSADNAGVALGIAIEGHVDNRSGIYYERGNLMASQQIEETGGMSMQYTYVVPDGVEGLLEVRGVFSSYGGAANANAVVQYDKSKAGSGISTLHVMAYSQLKP